MVKNEERRDFSVLIEQLLASYGVWSPAPGKWRSRCPIHVGDNATAFSVFANGRWRCFKCGAFGDMARLLVHVRKLTLKQAQDFVGSSPSAFFSMAGVEPLPPKRDLRKKLPYSVLSEADIALFKLRCPSYLRNRGFSEAALKRYEIGYDVESVKIVLPVRDANMRIAGLTYRLDFDADKTQPAKYWHDNFSKSLHLYGYHFWRERKLRRLYLVEGQLDAVRMHQLGFSAVAVMGSEISKDQVELLTATCRADSIVLGFDNDEAGYKARRDAIKKLTKTRFARTLQCMVYQKSDPGELDETDHISEVSWTSCLL